jgi:hypothetical protein
VEDRIHHLLKPLLTVKVKRRRNMSLTSGRISRVIIVALTIFWSCWLPFAGAVAATHDPLLRKQAELALHAQFDVNGQTELAHSHDDGQVEGKAPNHSHGHGPSDHTHELSKLLPTFIFKLATDQHNWSPHYPRLRYSIFSLPPERPPKSPIIA